MSGFIRRFGYFPGVETITQIEGVVIVDLPPPGQVQGVSTGVVGVVGEFADMTYSVSVDGSGAVTTFIRPQEITVPADLPAKFGGWDETLGDFGASGGSGFAALRSKRFSRLVVAAVNLASSKGVRVCRFLPLCTSSSDPTPVVPVQGGSVAAGREFTNGAGGRMRLAGRVDFTALDPIASGTGGATTNAAAAATQVFTVAAADFATISRPDGGLGVKKGDIVVIGNNNAGALAPLPSGGNLGAGTYRVAADAGASPDTTLELERLDGANFSFVTAGSIPYRIHVGSDADSAPVVVYGASVAGGYAAADAGGYTVPARPLTDAAGALADGTWAAGTVLAPRAVPPALTGSSWDPLTGLLCRVMPGGSGGLPYVAAVQQPNAAASASVDALYATALDALISEEPPANEVNVVFACRTSANIRAKLKSHALDGSARSRGRVVVVRPALTTVDPSAVVGDADPGVGANRDERVVYAWPGVQVFVPEAVNTRLKTALGTTTLDGMLDVGFDATVASILSVLPPERNPGQAAPPIPELMAHVSGLQRGAPKLEMDHYKRLRAAGIAAPKRDLTVGFVVQSGVTTSKVEGQKNISRRRMADFIQDSLARRLVNFSKLPLTEENKANAVTEVEAFMLELQSPLNRAAARIADAGVDGVSGNTASLAAKNVFVIIVQAKLIPTGDFIVLQTDIGEGVVVTRTLG